MGARLAAGLAFAFALASARGDPVYESTVRGASRHEGDHVSVEKQELYATPGTLGDPFRLVGVLPGVTMPFPIVPFWIVRGASPGMNGFFLDGMRVPQLFHFLIGGGVVHPRLVERLDFYPGGYDASLGRFAGGIIDAETRPARPKGVHGDEELRVYDAATLEEVALPGGVRIIAGGYYGWPSFILHAVEHGADVQFGDYQLRLDWRGITVEALGSYDKLELDNTALASCSKCRLEFHRVQVRDRHRVGPLAVEAAVVFGYDASAENDGTGLGLSIERWSASGRLILSARWQRVRFQLGTDAELSRFYIASGTSSFNPLMGWGVGRLGLVAGTFVSATGEIVPARLSATLGARADL